jgi:hypothetical protein
MHGAATLLAAAHLLTGRTAQNERQTAQQHKQKDSSKCSSQKSLLATLLAAVHLLTGGPAAAQQNKRDSSTSARQPAWLVHRNRLTWSMQTSDTLWWGLLIA